ncbi:hypothetical protein J7W19_03820 [Streptomyces mobaraensis NBRC 13819 = DSM 40847]|nr:hypothetical protein [Streptomyces mobaraensis]QTT72681.1 hypothetical protein J7W19_03820 [Streptomyces mobaraensis NBRC 13819 = DSM 40847]
MSEGTGTPDTGEASRASATRPGRMWEFLWGSPGLFSLTSMILFVGRWDRAAWNVYLLGWTPLGVMGLVSLLTHRKPHLPGLGAGLVLLVALGVFNALVHGDGYPY